MLSTGDLAPDFGLSDETGTTRRLSVMLEDGPVVLFFYPVALSGGCTSQACHFRDLAAEFAAAGGQRVGISTDAVGKQKEFADLNGFGYPLLSDPDGLVSEMFGVRRKLLKSVPVKRATFVIAPDRTIIEAFKNELKMQVHADRALSALARHGRPVAP